MNYIFYVIGGHIIKPLILSPPFRVAVFSFPLTPPQFFFPSTVLPSGCRLVFQLNLRIPHHFQLALSCLPKALTRGLWIGRYLSRIGWGYQLRTFGDVLSPLFTISNKICQGWQILLLQSGGAREDNRCE